MKFAVLGAGAIGAYVGAALARGGADVTLIARGPHLAAMQEHGVQVRSPLGDFTAHPKATNELRQSLAPDAASQASAIRLGEWLHATLIEFAATRGLPLLDAYAEMRRRAKP